MKLDFIRGTNFRYELQIRLFVMWIETLIFWRFLFHIYISSYINIDILTFYFTYSIFYIRVTIS